MALFKISKGSVANLDNQAKVDGYAWFTPEDGKFYIDAPIDKTTERIQLNSTYAVSATLTYANSTFTLGTPDKAYADIVKAKAAGNYVFFKLTFGDLVIMLPLSKTAANTSITFEGDFIYNSVMLHGNIVMNSSGTNSFTCNTILGGTYLGDFSAGSKKITNLADPAASADAVNLNYLSTNYKKVQSAVASPTASDSAIDFIDTISQNAQGVISATKKTVRDASTTQSGVVSTGAQSFAGNKTFSNNVIITGTTTLNNDVTIASGKNLTLTNGWVISSKTPEDKMHLVNKAYADALLSTNDAMLFKGILGTGTDMIKDGLPAEHEAGWTYKVGTAGSYADQWCEIGDTIYCIKDGTTASNNDWAVVQVNIDGAVTGPASSTDNALARFNGDTGKVIQNSSATLDDDGKLSAPYIETGSAAANYFQSRKFRGEGNANTYYHAIDFGYEGHNQVDFHEYGGIWNFYKNTSGTSSGGTLVASIQSDGFHGALKGNADTATSVGNSFIIKLNSGSTENTDLFTFNGSEAKTLNITASGIGAAAASHTHNYAGSSSAGGAATTALTCTGNAATATKLATAKTITIGNTGKSFDGSANVSWTLSEIGAGNTNRIVVQNKTVATSAWASNSTYSDYPYRAAIAITGVTASHLPEVIFSCSDATGGNFAPVCESYAGGVYIWAKEKPTATVTIPTIECRVTA